MSHQLVKTLIATTGHGHKISTTLYVKVTLNSNVNLESGGIVDVKITSTNTSSTMFKSFDNTPMKWNEFQDWLDTLFKEQQAILNKRSNNIHTFEILCDAFGYEQV